MAKKPTSMAMLLFLAITRLKIDKSWKFYYQSIKQLKSYRMIPNSTCQTLHTGEVMVKKVNKFQNIGSELKFTNLDAPRRQLAGLAVHLDALVEEGLLQMEGNG